MDYNAKEDSIDLPGSPSSWGKYGYLSKSNKEILFGYYEDDISKEYLMSIKSKQPITIDDINFV